MNPKEMLGKLRFRLNGGRRGKMEQTNRNDKIRILSARGEKSLVIHVNVFVQS
jgi:hypothetical protein